MFGHWGFPAMGLAGAGWATLVSRILMLVGLWYTPGRGEVRWADGLQLAVFRRLLSTGWPAGLHSLSEVGIFAVVPVMAGWINATAQAAHQVAISTASAAFMLPLGLGIAAGIRVGEAYGAKDARKVQAVGLGAMILGGVMMGAYGLAMILLRPLLMETYGVAGTETAALASSLLIFAAIWAPFDGVQVVAAYLLRSVNRALALAFPPGFRLFGLPVGRWDLGAAGIWIALATGLVLVSLVMGWKFRRSAQTDVDA
jgi:MATE family multidrug resistance protein